MSHFLDIALACLKRGYYVIPCDGKEALVKGGTNWELASNDEAQIRSWWAKWPNANVAITGNLSENTVLDIDYGFTDEAEWRAWCERNGIPETYTVRTGGRPGFRVQMYFCGRMNDVGKWELDGASGQIKSTGGYVMAAGSIHPDSGERYEAIRDISRAPLPDAVRQLRKPEKVATGNAKVSKSKWDLPVHEGEDRTGFLVEQSGNLRRLGYGEAVIRAHMQDLNEDTEIIADPIDQTRLEETAAGVCRYQPEEQLPEIVFGNSKKPAQTVTDWRSRYHSFDEMNNAPEPTFIIEGFLPKDVISSIAAPVGQRKTIIAANVVHSSLTGEPLFDHFPVKERPVRVLYLCPEMGLFSFAKRIRNLELMDYVGKTLFCRTMNSEGKLPLSDLTNEELTGALVVIDTAVRFVEGDENSSEDMKVFAEDCFRLMKAGAASVLVLFHSPKGTKDASELTLENAMRGSGDLGAFVSSCWATRLQDPDAPWESASYLKNVKQRDFESDPFEVRSDKLGRLHIVTKPGEPVKLNSKSVGPRGNADGKEAEALQIIKDNPALSLSTLVRKLADAGIERSKSWVSDKRYEIHGGVKASA